MSIHKKVPVVIPHFRAPEPLKVAIGHLHRQRGIDVEIFVRDNSDDNILFTRAINEGLKKYAFTNDVDYILMLNQDACLSEDCLLNMVLAMDAIPSAGIAGPILLSEDGQINWRGSADAFPWGMHIVSEVALLPDDPYETYWNNGACMLLRTAMIREIGLLDPNMRFVCSDADYSFTARARGWRCIVVPNAFVQHEPAGSQSLTPWIDKLKLEDQLYFADKWLTGDLYRRLAMEGPRLSDELIQTHLAKTREVLAIYRDQNV
jgi:GT2 family glycosyltransferase